MNPKNNRLIEALTCRGVLVNVSIRYWRARRKLTPEDLGLDAEQVDKRLISLGHKRLLPQDCLRNLALLESRTHALVEANTFPFLNGMARYLPNCRLTEIDARLNALHEQFDAEVDEFLRLYPDYYRREALQEWDAAARALEVDPERLLAVIEEAFPEPDSMRRRFSFRVDFFQVAAPAPLQAELVEAGVQAELAEARAKAARKAERRIEQSCEEFIRDCTAELRSQTATLCSEMLRTIDGAGSVHQKTLNRLLRFIEHFRQLNFVGDEEMERRLEEVRREFLQRTAGEYRASDAARRELVQGLEALRDRARDLAQQDAGELVAKFGRLGERKFILAA